MKRILLLMMAVVFLLLTAGCTQSAPQVQPAATTATPTLVKSTVTATPAASLVTTSAPVSDNTIIIQKMAYNPAQTHGEGRRYRAVGQQGHGCALGRLFQGLQDRSVRCTCAQPVVLREILQYRCLQLFLWHTSPDAGLRGCDLNDAAGNFILSDLRETAYHVSRDPDAYGVPCYRAHCRHEQARHPHDPLCLAPPPCHLLHWMCGYPRDSWCSAVLLTFFSNLSIVRGE